MDEFAFIAKYLKPLAGKEALALKDDAAIIPGPAGLEYVVTKDALIEGVHFLQNTDPADLAYKILGVNLSDLAAMGATPRFYLCAACLNPGIDEAWMAAFTAALSEIQRQYGLALIGGDTTRHAGGLVFSITMIGEVPAGKALLRSGAKAGDDLWLSGQIGDAALGLKGGKFAGRYLRPQPRVELGLALRGIATAAIDISDGLVADVGHIAAASGVRVKIAAEDIPIAVENTLELALTGGDDYELAFTAPANVGIEKIAGQLPLQLTKIGRVEAGVGVEVLDAAGEQLHFKRAGYTHF